MMDPLDQQHRRENMPLALVQCGLLRADARLAPLDGVVALLTQCLDVSPLISLPAAAVKGSLRLFDWVAARVMADTATHKAQVDFWFARAMQAALERDDLAMLQRIHALHPAPLCLYVPIVSPILYTTSLGVAFKHCTLETIEWLVANRADRACCRPGVRPFCRGCVLDAMKHIGDHDALRIVLWLFDSGILSYASPRAASEALWRPMQLSAVLVRWAADHELLSQKTALRLMHTVTSEGRSREAMELLDVIAAPMAAMSARAILLRASFQGLSDVVDKLISLGHCDAFQYKFVLAPPALDAASLVQWDQERMLETDAPNESTAAEICCETALRCGNLVALQWLFHERGHAPDPSELSDVKKESTLLEICKWMHAVELELPALLMNDAAGQGFLNVVQWLHAHSTAGCTKSAMDNAASHGHLEVLEWLHANRSEGCTTQAMNGAAANGQLHVVQWLHTHRRDEIAVTEAIRHATAYGQLDVLLWLTREYPEAVCTRCITDTVLIGTWMSMGRVKSIDVLRWNDSQPVAVCPACRRGIRLVR